MMRIRTYFYVFFSLVLVAMPGLLNAQDYITLNDEQVVHGKVMDIGLDEVSYLKAQFPEGPTYTISKKVICKIEYSSGRVEFFGKCKKKEERLAQREQMKLESDNLWCAGRKRISLIGSYAMPMEDFREGNVFEGPQAIDGFSVGLNYFQQFSFLPKRMALRGSLVYSNFAARFDTSFAGFDVGGGDFLNIQISPAQWSVIDLSVSVPVLLIGRSNVELSIAPQVGVSHVLEPALNGSSSFFFINTSFNNTQDQSTALVYGGTVALNFPFSDKLSAGLFSTYQRGNLLLDTDYSFTINGTTTREQNQLDYSFSRLNVGFQLIYAL